MDDETCSWTIRHVAKSHILVVSARDSESESVSEQSPCPVAAPSPVPVPLTASRARLGQALLKREHHLCQPPVKRDRPVTEKLIRLDMARDSGVHPGLVERAFRKSSWATYRARTGKEHAIAGIVEQATKVEALQSDIAALEATQAQRPLKPPGKRL